MCIVTYREGCIEKKLQVATGKEILQDIGKNFKI